MATTILITGGCGFIGSNLVNRLVATGANILALDDLTAGNRAFIDQALKKPNCQFIKGSITDFPLLTKTLRDVDVVLHEAARPDVRASTANLFSDFAVNVQGTVNLLEAMIKNDVPKILFASSCGTVYGESAILPTPEDVPLAPISHYGASKAASEMYLSSFASLYGLEAYALRLGNIYGPPSNHGVMHDFYWKLKKDPTTLEILGNGEQLKSYLFVEDCVNAHLKALKTKIQGYLPINIASIEGTTVNTIAKEVITAMGLKEVRLTYTGGERGWAGDVRKAVPDISRAKEVLHWEPTTALSTGIKKYIQWLEQSKKTD